MGGYAQYVIELPPELARGVAPLRVCRECGLIAFTEKELNLFRKASMAAYGRSTMWQECSNRLGSEKYWRSKKELIEGFGGPLICHFCGEEITKLKGGDKESLVIHSLDGNHRNWESSNKVPTHLRCHSRYEQQGSRSSQWKGDKASDEAKARRMEQKR